LRALIIVLALILPSVADAKGTVGVLVTGDVLKGPTQTQAEKWLREHDQTVVTNALPAAAVKTLLDCFVIDDPKCSRGLIDARATTDSFVAIRIDVVSKKDKDIRLTVDWFTKGRNPVSARRTCEDCTESVLRTTVDAILLDLAKSNPGFMGRIKVISDPAGITVLLDNETIGVTPIERDVAAGKHVARLVLDGRMGAEKSVKIEPGAQIEVKLESPPAGGIVEPTPVRPVHHSRVVPGLMIGVGVAAALAGGAMIYFGGPTGEMDEYTDYRTPGYFVAGGGGVLALTGVIIILATPNRDGPTVGAAPGGGATIGWIGRF
jgi:hypothetical protein